MATKKKSVKNRVSSKKLGSERLKYSQNVTDFVEGVSSEIRGLFADTLDLATFRKTASGVTKSDRLLIVEQALVFIERNYVHLPLKQAMHATDPVQALKLLQYRTVNDAAPMSDLEFHRAMSEIFMSVRDLHTNYMLPDPFRTMIAFVPFMIEEFTEDGEQRYLVTNISNGFDAAPFEPGVEVVAWNGIPIQRAVEIQGNRFAGSNLEARRARGTATLTVRRLLLALPPDEDFVIVGYRDATIGQLQELRVDWLVISEPGLAGDMQPAEPRDAKAVASIGSDLEMEAVQDIQKYLYAGHAAADEARKAKLHVPSESTRAATASSGATVQGNGFAAHVPSSVMEGRTVETTSGDFGYIRIRTFRRYTKFLPFEDVIQSYVDRFVQLAESLPQNGLIVDVRGNGGGIVTAGERLLQLMSPRKIQPEPTQFITSPLNLDICRHHNWLAPWVESLEEAVLTGAQYSRGVPMTSPEEANDTGQRYFGPVVLVTDALCYSTTDIFAAGFQDHRIGPVIGVHNNTGAGGANVWAHNHFIEFFYPPAVSGSPYSALPQNANMRISMRRTMRVHENAGTPVEDLGVIPNHHHPLTRNDILNGNEDMLDFAGSVLANLPVRNLRVVQQSVSNGDLNLTVETQGLTGCDVFADGRAQGSIEIEDGVTALAIPAADAEFVELRGFNGSEVVAVRRVEMQ